MKLPALPRIDPTGPAQLGFEAAARATKMDPDDRWVGGYAAYEWDHVRLALEAYGIDVEGRDVLEFGCNVGGSAVVLTALGARLSGVDIDPLMLPIAQANLARHGFGGDLGLALAGEPLPFDDASFDLILANSVLEMVELKLLDPIIAEFHRVLRPGGQLFICGTASGIVLRERHSGRWLVNYWPRAFDRLMGREIQRGLSPWSLASALSGRFAELDEGMAWLAARQAIHGSVSSPVRAYALLGRLMRRSPGSFSPFIELLLRKI